MDPLKVAAQFAAILWFAKNTTDQKSCDESVAFARDNWVAFLPQANEAVGSLLLKLAEDRTAKPRRTARRRLAAAGRSLAARGPGK